MGSGEDDFCHSSQNMNIIRHTNKIQVFFTTYGNTNTKDYFKISKLHSIFIIYHTFIFIYIKFVLIPNNRRTILDAIYDALLIAD